MTQRMDVDVRVSVPVPKRANFSAKVGVAEEARRIADAIIERARQDHATVPGLILSAQPPKERTYPDPQPAAGDSAPGADTAPAAGAESAAGDHLPPADAETVRGRRVPREAA